VPITQTFGPNRLVSFKVWTDEIDPTADEERSCLTPKSELLLSRLK